MPDRHHVLRFQATYYCATGMLPLASMRTFETLTGKKCDRWLVQMVGLLATAIGLSLGVSSLSEEIEPASLTLSCSAALAFAGIDIVHTCRRRISPVYLVDAAVELLILAVVLKA